MTYGLNSAAFIEHGPAASTIAVASNRSRARTWRALDHDHRLRIVERAMKPANDLADSYPIAL